MRGIVETLRRKVLGVTPRPVILMYHRVATPAVDPWELSVSPANFDSQIAALKASRMVLPLAAYASLAGEGALPADAVAITFDDGYLDNLACAMPILKRHAAPATFFISTGFTGAATEFWWDELARMILIPGGGNEALYQDTWAHLQGLSQADRDGAMAELRMRFEATDPDPADLPMNADEVRTLAAEPLAAIGAHSVSHPRLADLSPAERAAEITDSRRACEAMTGGPVDAFAYPFGNMSAAAREAVREAGFAFACSTEATVTKRRDADLFALPRIAAPDVDGATLLARLRAAGARASA